MPNWGLETFQAELFKALSGEQNFGDVIRRHAQASGAVSGVVFALNRRTGEIENWTSPDLPFGDDAYSQHINSINPRMHFSLAHAPGHVAFESRFISEQAMASHEFYDWLDREFSMKHFLGSRLFDEGDISVFHSIEFDKSKSAPDRDDVRVFSRKAQALANAWKISNHITVNTAPLVARDFTPDHLPWAIFAMSPDGRVLSMNTQATNQVQSADTVTLGPTLTTTSHATQGALVRALKAAIGGTRQELILTGQITKAKSVVQIVPVTDHPQVAALLYLWNPTYRSENTKKVLMSLWRLTPQEAELTLAITSGASLKDASEQLGITRNTGRNHLNSVFSKLEINSQLELVSRIFGILS